LRKINKEILEEEGFLILPLLAYSAMLQNPRYNATSEVYIG